MKVSKKEINLLIGLLGILIAYVAYQFGYLKLNDMAEKKAAENAKMRAEISQLQMLEPRKEQFVADTATMEEEMTAWIAQFPSGVLPEDDIKLAYQMDNRNDDNYLFINAMSFADGQQMYVTNQNTSTDTQTSDVQLSGVVLESGSLYPTYTLYQAQVTYGIDSGYKGLKNLITNIYHTNERKAVESVSVTFDESNGRLNGSVVMNSYYVLGTEIPYAEPILTPVRQGTDNIFGTIDVAPNIPVSNEGEAEESEH